MAEKMELGFLKQSVTSIKEQMARCILHRVRLQGHTYVEIREDGKRFIFFCTLCLARCYSDTVLFDHLKGNLHTERLATAKVTLLKPNPWPFNDGVHFFHSSAEVVKPFATSNGNRNVLLAIQNDDNMNVCCEDLASTRTGENVDLIPSVDNLNGNEGNCGLLIPGVMINDKMSILKVKPIGFGQIGARICEKDGEARVISRIWCEWLGGNSIEDVETLKIPEHDFAVVTFPYNYDLGRRDLLENFKVLLTSSPDRCEGNRKKRKKSLSDPGDVSDSLSHQYDSSGEESCTSVGSSRLLLDKYDDRLLNRGFMSNKNARKELRRQQRLVAEKLCDICKHKMLPDKDVATLMNMKTGKLACSSRNVNGAFHVFHISCLVHWILLCENEIFANRLLTAKVEEKPKRKNGMKKKKGIEKDEIIIDPKRQIVSLFCPECQGRGIIVEEDELEKPPILLSEIFKYKIKIGDAHRAWMKNPEILQNCSTGFHFPSLSQESIEEKVLPQKLLRFFKADE